MVCPHVYGTHDKGQRQKNNQTVMNRPIRWRGLPSEAETAGIRSGTDHPEYGSWADIDAAGVRSQVGTSAQSQTHATAYTAVAVAPRGMSVCDPEGDMKRKRA